LQKIIDFGRHIHVKYIELSDESMVDSNTCKSSVALAAFEILTSGSSWYNKHGFKSEYHDNETIQNEKISNTLFDKIITEKIKKNFKNQFFETNGKTLKDVLLELKHRYLKRGYTELLDQEQCKTIEDLTMYLNYEIIVYNNRLKLFLGGKKQKKTKHKKQNTKNKTQKTKHKTQNTKNKNERNKKKKLKNN
jgi:hypothetical protein